VTALPECRHMRALISLNADGEANDLERAAVSRHVRTCAACLEFQELVTAVRDAQSSPAEVIPEPVGLGLRLAAVVRHDVRSRRTRQPMRSLLAGSVAALLVVVVLGWWVKVGDGWIGWVSKPGSEMGSVTLQLPRVTASRVLDVTYESHSERAYSDAGSKGTGPNWTLEERTDGSTPPISWFDEAHYRPTSL
jgi:predicted anti-sigma-YlaC factor YlaD